MSKSIYDHKDLYIAMMHEFRDGAISAFEFQKKFLEMRRLDLALDDKIKQTWELPHDELLIARLRSGEVSTTIVPDSFLNTL